MADYTGGGADHTVTVRRLSQALGSVKNYADTIKKVDFNTVSDNHFKSIIGHGLLNGKVAIVTFETDLQTGLSAWETINCATLPWASDGTIYKYTSSLGLNHHDPGYFTIKNNQILFCSMGGTGLRPDNYSATLVYMIA